MGSITLPMSGLIYLDTNGFIYSLEKIEPYCSILKPLWETAKEGTTSIICSELIRLEALIKPLRAGNKELIELFQTVFNSREVRLIQVDTSIWDKAAHLRASIMSLKTPDAIHAATALLENCNLFITNDPAFRRVDGLSVTLLSEC